MQEGLEEVLGLTESFDIRGSKMAYPLGKEQIFLLC